MPDINYTITPEFSVPTQTDLNNEKPVITAIDGGFVVVWQYGNTISGFQTFMRLFDDQGNATTADIAIGQFEQNQRIPTVSATDNGILVAWMDFDENFQVGSDVTNISAQFFDLSGNATSGVFQLDDTIRNIQPDIHILDNGGFIATWITNGSVVARFFDSNGTALSDSFVVSPGAPNPTLPGRDRVPVVTELSDGNIVITWESILIDGSGRGVQAVVLDSNGIIVRPEFQVNTHVFNDQDSPAVGALANGGFVVVWESFGQDGDRDGVYFQLYDDVGNAVGTETQVNGYTGGQQGNPDVVTRSDGTFLVTWDSPNSFSNADIFVQLFDQNGSAIGSEVRVNLSQFGSQREPSVTVLEDGTFAVIFDNTGQGLDILAQLISVEFANGDPIAIDDNGFTVSSVGNLTILPSELLANDSDPDGDPFSIVSFGQAEHGAIFLGNDGSIRYFSDGTFVGTDDFEYTITDGNGGFSTATVEIEVTDDGVVVVQPGPGKGVFVGSPNDDAIRGSLGDDRINGLGGGDTINGSAGDDEIKGQGGDDDLTGGDGNDSISGGDGNDILLGSAGNDSLSGGSGSDAFVFFGQVGNDIIEDFDRSAGDVLLIDSTLIVDGVGNPNVVINEIGGDTLLTLNDGSTIDLLGVTNFAFGDIDLL